MHDAYGLELLMQNIHGLWVDHARPNLWLNQWILGFVIYLDPCVKEASQEEAQ